MTTPEHKAKRAALSRRNWAKLSAWIIEQKSKPCADCGLSWPYYVMDFDHRPGETKLFKVSARATRGKAVVEAEIAKCDLVCANCHRIRTHSRSLVSKQHIRLLPGKEEVQVLCDRPTSVSDATGVAAALSTR